MAGESRMTVRLDAAVRRKLERFAERNGLSLNEALNRLLALAPENEGEAPRRPYRLKPRKVSFGFDIADAKRLAQQIQDEVTLEKLKRRP